MNWEEERHIHKKPERFKLEKDDVWGKFDSNHNMISSGMVVARGYPRIDEYFTKVEFDKLNIIIPNICPVWKDTLPYKSVTVICNENELNEVLYWLEYVHGGEHSKMEELSDNRIAIRSDYQCW